MGPREGGGGVGHAVGNNQTRPWLQGLAKWNRVGPVRVEWGRVGPSRAEWGWGGVGHALVDRPSGAAWGRVGPSRGRLVLSGVGEGLGMHWDSIKLL